MSYTVTVEQIGEAGENLHELKERYLRQHGWEISCDFPGSIWLWCKDIRGRQIAVNMDVAYGMESYDEEMRLDAEEEKQANAQHGV